MFLLILLAGLLLLHGSGLPMTITVASVGWPLMAAVQTVKCQGMTVQLVSQSQKCAPLHCTYPNVGWEGGELGRGQLVEKELALTCNLLGSEALQLHPG